MTNYSINKKNKNLKSKKTLIDDTLPYKWSLTAFFHRLSKCGIDPNLIWEQIYDVIIKSILSSERYISFYTKEKFKKIHKSFEIFGYDIMIDENLKPWVMEINLSPSLSLESSMDIKLKTKLVTEMFNMYGFRKQRHAVDLTENKSDDEGDNSDEADELDQPDKPMKKQKGKKANIKNLKYIEPELSEKQKDKVINIISEDETLSDSDRNYMIKLLNCPYKDAITETLSEFTRKEDYIRIFPTKGSDAYFKFFHYDLPVNHELYSFLYEEEQS